MNQKQLAFEVKSGVMRVTDPCYQRDTWCCGTVPAKNGRWIGVVELSDEGSWGTRVKRLTAHHESASAEVSEFVPIEVGVDSGQAGFFDDAAYPSGDTNGEYGDLSTFYGRACAQTCDESNPEQRAGIVNWNGYDMGLVSSSGFGDGGYSLYGRKEGEVFVALSIEFISDDEGEDEDEDEEQGEAA